MVQFSDPLHCLGKAPARCGSILRAFSWSPPGDAGSKQTHIGWAEIWVPRPDGVREALATIRAFALTEVALPILAPLALIVELVALPVPARPPLILTALAFACM